MKFAKFTWPFLKHVISKSVNKYCYHVDVMNYTQKYGERKGIMKKINEVSQLVGVSKRTLQYYDDEGILLIERTTNNHRVYDQHTLEQIWQILIYKEMDFELNEIKSLLNLPQDKKEQCFRRQIKKIENKIVTMEVKLKFISFVQQNGFPMKPGDNCGKTYMMQIKEIKENMKKEIQGRNKIKFY